MKNIRLNNELSKYIKNILLDRDIDMESVNDSTLNLYVSKMSNRNIPVIDSKTLGLDGIDDYFMFHTVDKNKEPEELLKIIGENITSEIYNYNKLNFYFIFSTLNEQLLFEDEIRKNNFAKKILKIIKDKCKNDGTLDQGKFSFTVIDVDCNIAFIGTEDPDSLEIHIDNRIRSLETSRHIDIDKEKKTKLNLKGYVFSANLSDIVKIYSVLGNKLFSSNVRYGIDDELNVDSQIKYTLKTNPDDFWYLNNGITMIIQDDEFSLNKLNSLQIKYGEGKLLSIINGAQTISASAEFFYTNTYSNEEKSNAISKAKVMLRVIRIYKTGEVANEEYIKACNTEIDKISISLNRQKPIKPEDIAYTMPFIYSINRLKEKKSSDSIYFALTRRGEETTKGYDLVQFSRAVKAYLAQKPGQARTQGSKTLLGIHSDNGSYTFIDSDIFKQELIDTNIDNDISFQKYYRPVNFAIKLEKCYSHYIKYQHQTEKDEQVIKGAVLSYGKWYFVAYMIYVLNKYSNEDFTNFNVDIDRLDNTSIKEFIEEYINLFSKVIPEYYKTVDSNDFKKNELFLKFRDYINNGSNNELKKSIEEFNNRILDNFDLVKKELAEIKSVEQYVAVN